MKCLWFTSLSTVGIVQIFDENTKEHKYYISGVTGIDEEIDKKFIKDYGAKFPKEIGDALFEKYS